MMTVSWGSVGVIWASPRDGRGAPEPVHLRVHREKRQLHVWRIFREYKDELTLSGRDPAARWNKVKATGLTPIPPRRCRRRFRRGGTHPGVPEDVLLTI